MVADVSHSASKLRLRLEAFKNGTPPYDGAARMPTATERRKEARAAESAVTLCKRSLAIAKAADELLDLKMVDLAAALSNSEQWTETSEALAKAAEAVAMLQSAIAGMVPK